MVFGLPLLLLLARQVLWLGGTFGWRSLWHAHQEPGEEALLVLVASPALLVLLWAAMLGTSALALVNAWVGRRGVAGAGFACGLAGLGVGAAQALACAVQGGLLALADHRAIDPFLEQGYLLHADLPFAIGLVLLAGGFTRLCHPQAGRRAGADCAVQQGLRPPRGPIQGEWDSCA